MKGTSPALVVMLNRARKIGFVAFIALELLSTSLAQVEAPAAPAEAEAPLSPSVPIVSSTETPEKTPEELEKEKNQQKTKEYNDFKKELVKYEGLFAFYVPKNNKQIYVELKDGDFGKMWMFEATLYSGASAFPLQAGDPVAPEEDIQAIKVYRWEKLNDHVSLIEPHLKYRWNPSSPYGVAFERSFPETRAMMLPVFMSNPESNLVLVDVTNLFYGNTLDLAGAVKKGLGNAFVNMDGSYLEMIKAFPDNTLLRMNLNVSYSGPEQFSFFGLVFRSPEKGHVEGKGSIPLKVTYNMWEYKPTVYRPRFADPRVGYFTQEFKEVGARGKPIKIREYIKRFAIAKKDPKAALSEPVKPIEFILDPSIPEKYKVAVREGVLRWNKAFEAIGYQNAIVVKDAPKDDPDYDHANGKYNVIRWAVSTSDPYAIALMRTDPFTGEILNASVTFDVNWLAVVKRDYEELVIPGTLALQDHTLDLNQINGVLKDPIQFGLLKNPAKESLKKGLLYEGWSKKGCTYGYTLAPHSAFAYQAALSYAPSFRVNKEEYEKQLISDVTAHEIGHLLGLRHNFKGSEYLTTAELASDHIIREKNSTASVMDYLPPNIQAVLGKSKYFYPPEIGVYDMWAIRYGYMDIDAPSPEAEKPVLKKVAAESSKPGHEYASDEALGSADPFAMAFDNSKDPIEYASKVIDAAKHVERYALRYLPVQGKSTQKRTRLLIDAIYQKFSAGAQVSKFIGGIETHKYHLTSEGTERPTLKPVDSASQYAAMNLIVKDCLSIDSVNYPENVLNSLSYGYYPPESTWNAPLRSMIHYLQVLILGRVLSPSTLDQIAENQFKVKASKKAYTVMNHLDLIVNSVFYEIERGMNVKPLRRDLQLAAVEFLMAYAGSLSSWLYAGDSEAKLAASGAMKGLLAKIDSRLRYKAALDQYTVLHLEDLKDTIERFQKRQRVTF